MTHRPPWDPDPRYVAEPRRVEPLPHDDDLPDWVLTAVLAIIAIAAVIVAATPRSGQTTDRVDMSPVASAALSGAPRSGGGAPPSPAAEHEQPTDPAGSATVSATLDDVTRQGVISHVGSGFPDDYLALPIGPGHQVRLCGPADCVVMVSTDAGPDLAMQRAGRIADVSVAVFERISGLPASRGLAQGTWTLTGAPTLPPTDGGSR